MREEMTAGMHRNGETLLVARAGHVLAMNINVLKQLNRRRTRGFFAINSQLAICIGDTISAIRRHHRRIDRKIALRWRLREKDEGDLPAENSITILCRFLESSVRSVVLLWPRYAPKVPGESFVPVANERAAAALHKSLFILWITKKLWLLSNCFIIVREIFSRYHTYKCWYIVLVQ